MRRVVALLGLVCLAASLASGQVPAAPDAGRRVTSRIAPSYPELAKKMRLQGTVRVEAVVRANGTVKSTRVLGGNPVLVNAAIDAVTKWKFAAGPSETTEPLELTFIPQ